MGASWLLLGGSRRGENESKPSCSANIKRWGLCQDDG